METCQVGVFNLKALAATILMGAVSVYLLFYEPGVDLEVKNITIPYGTYIFGAICGIASLVNLLTFFGLDFLWKKRDKNLIQGYPPDLKKSNRSK